MEICRMCCSILAGVVLRLCLLQGAEGFEKAERDVAMGGVLPGEQRDLLPEDGEVQGPVKSRSTTLTSPPRVW